MWKVRASATRCGSTNETGTPELKDNMACHKGPTVELGMRAPC